MASRHSQPRLRFTLSRQYADSHYVIAIISHLAIDIAELAGMMKPIFRRYDSCRLRPFSLSHIVLYYATPLLL